MKYVLFLILLNSYFHGYSQGRVDGFYKGKGNFDAVLSGGYEHNPYYFAGRNKITLTRDIYILNTFLAYGITDKFDVNFSLPYINVNNNEKSLQDLSLTLKHLIFKLPSKTSISGSLGFSSNLTNYQTGGGSAIGQQAKVIDGRIVIHQPLKNSIFLTAQTGYSYKFNPTPSALPFAIKLGIAHAKFYADVWYEYQYSFGGLDYKGTPAPMSFKELGVDYHKIGATFYKQIKKKLGVVIGGSYVFLGRNSVQGFGINAGIVYKHYKKTKK